MFQHLTHAYELPFIDFMKLMQRVVIKGVVDGQVRVPPNFEQPRVVQKKKLKKISNYGMILPIRVSFHISRIFTIKNHDLCLVKLILVVLLVC